MGERNASQLRDGPEQLLIGLELISGGQYLLRLYPENNRNSIIIYTRIIWSVIIEILA